jgi:hypothetical protein
LSKETFVQKFPNDYFDKEEKEKVSVIQNEAKRSEESLLI